jgi:hypothetical protein
MIPVYPKFKPVRVKDKDIISNCFNTVPRRICELSFPNLIIWGKFDRPQYTYINKNLCILISSVNEPPYFLEPLSKNKPMETLEICLEYAGRLSRLSEDYASEVAKDKFEIAELRNQFDYIYVRSDLAELKGKKFDGKRNHIKRFLSNYPDYQFVPLSKGSKKDAVDLFNKWFEIRKESKFYPKLAYTAQKEAIELAFDNYDGLSLLGGGIILKGILKGFILGSKLNKEMVSSHFSYGDPEIAGISQMLLWEACNKAFSEYPYVDLEQDIGIPGLRSAKLSYHPMKLEKKYEIAPRQEKT